MYGGHQVSLFTILPVVAKLLSLSSNQVPRYISLLYCELWLGGCIYFILAYFIFKV